MSGDIVVFLGPSLEVVTARAILRADYRPPAEQGSVDEAVRSGPPRTVVLIDGAFGNVPAVRHKEILWALSQGVEVVGASSMGAIRAAELSTAGMAGHGFVYRWYRATPFADDDEVAVAMAPAELGSRRLGDALIDMRLTLKLAARRAILTLPQAARLEAIARSTYFVERSYDRLLERGLAECPRDWVASIEALRAWLPRNRVEQKRDDAIGLLRLLAAQGGLASGSLHAAAPFRMTEAWALDREAAGVAKLSALRRR